MQRRAHESTSGVPVQWPVSVVQKPLGLRQSKKIPSKNFWVQRLEMAKQMKNIRQQRADERDKAAQIFTWCMVVAMHQEEGIGATRLERACNEMHEFQQRYRTKILTENRKSATDAMREDLKGIPNVAGSTAYTSNWVAELFGPSNLKKSTSGFPQRLYNSVLQGALGIDKDGIFGANTEKTVKEFQSAHGLTADGIAGAKTKAALAKQL